MLMNLNKKGWSEGLKTDNFKDHDKVRLALPRRLTDCIRATSKFSQRRLVNSFWDS